MKSLQIKTVLTVIMVFFVFGLTLFFFTDRTLRNGFESVETRDANLNISRVKDAVQAEIENLSLKMGDWSAWDDTYKYIADHNKEYEKSNLNSSTLANLKMNYILFLDANLNLVFGRKVDFVEGRDEPVTNDLFAQLKNSGDLLQFSAPDEKKDGMMLLDGMPALVSVQPIVTSEGKGPIHGIIFVARSLNAYMMDRLKKVTHLPLQQNTWASQDPEWADIKKELTSPLASTLRLKGSDKIQGSVRFDDLLGAPLMVMSMETPRDVFAVGLQTLSSLSKILTLLSLGSAFLIALVLITLTRAVNRQLVSVSQVLEAAVQMVRKSSSVVSDSSQSISVQSDQQAGAVQRTAASTREMTAMIQRTTENILHSEKIYGESRTLITKARSSVEEMAASIQGMQQAQREISEQMTADSNEFQRLVQVIGQIGQRTQVIHDIVFQTKLLSFNASVEAARAGESGKGFSVVAEEVAKLASMSGAAAEEIATHLATSSKEVESIVSRSRERGEMLMRSSESKLQEGLKTVKASSEILETLVRQSQEVSTVAQEIAQASKEESVGVQEINRAIEEIELSLRTNTQSARDTTQNALRLTTQSQSLEEAVLTLDHVLERPRDSSS